MESVEQRIASAMLSDGTNVAYALSGHGPFLVYAPGWLTHLELSALVPLRLPGRNVAGNQLPGR